MTISDGESEAESSLSDERIGVLGANEQFLLTLAERWVW